MKEEFFRYFFAGICEHLAEKGDLELELKLLGYDAGKRMIIKDNFEREDDVQFLLYNITFKFLPRFYNSTRKIEKSETEKNTFLMTENTPFFNKYISAPDDLSFSCDSFIAGVIEAVLMASGHKSEVQAHNSPTEKYPDRVIYEIKVQKDNLNAFEL